MVVSAVLDRLFRWRFDFAVRPDIRAFGSTRTRVRLGIRLSASRSSWTCRLVVPHWRRAGCWRIYILWDRGYVGLSSRPILDPSSSYGADSADVAAPASRRDEFCGICLCQGFPATPAGRRRRACSGIPALRRTRHRRPGIASSGVDSRSPKRGDDENERIATTAGLLTPYAARASTKSCARTLDAGSLSLQRVGMQGWSLPMHLQQLPLRVFPETSSRIA